MLLAAGLATGPAGCSPGGEKTVTVEKTVTASPTSTGSSRADKETYVNQIDDFAGQADGINRSFRELIEKYNAGEARVEDLVEQADQNRRSYEDMSVRLTEMSVPREFQQAHKSLISGFYKWQSTFDAYREGFKQNNSTLLDKARDLDNQAVIEVNQAINEISQVELS